MSKTTESPYYQQAREGDELTVTLDRQILRYPPTFEWAIAKAVRLMQEDPTLCRVHVTPRQ